MTGGYRNARRCWRLALAATPVLVCLAVQGAVAEPTAPGAVVEQQAPADAKAGAGIETPAAEKAGAETDVAATPPADPVTPPPPTAAEPSAQAPPANAADTATTTTVPAATQPEAHEKVDTNEPSLLTIADAPKKRQWEAENGGFTASRFAIARRLNDRPERLLSARSTLPRDREDFLWRVARDTWAGIQAYTDRDSGLVIDNVRIIGGMVPPLAIKVGDYTNITNVGLQLAAIVSARRLGLLPDVEARGQISQIIDTLATLKRHAGYFFNYYDTTSLEPTSSFLSFVDTAWLLAGLIVARQGFPDLESAINEIADPLDLQWFYDDSTGLMSHGYYVNIGGLSAFEYGTFFTEARLGSLLAIGKGDAPESHWYAMKRASRSACMAGECPELEQLEYETGDGRKMKVSHYRWRVYEYVPSWGGSMFEALMPRLMIDETRYAPRSLGPNGYAHAVMQKIYATEVKGFPVWGMSPCISPDTGLYGEFGVRALGNHGYSETVVTPHAAALALAVVPDDAAETLMEMARRYDIYGPFGFYDAVEPATGKVAYDQLALDQLMLFLAVTNHLSGDYVPSLFAEDPWVKDALPLLAEERFFD